VERIDEQGAAGVKRRKILTSNGVESKEDLPSQQQQVEEKEYWLQSSNMLAICVMSHSGTLRITGLYAKIEDSLPVLDAIFMNACALLEQVQQKKPEEKPVERKADAKSRSCSQNGQPIKLKPTMTFLAIPDEYTSVLKNLRASMVWNFICIHARFWLCLLLIN